MSRSWPLRFVCAHEGCAETVNYSYSTKRDMMESFELKNYSNGRWLCMRHAKPLELLTIDNLETRAELVVETKDHGNYFGHSGFVSGPGFRVFAKDLPEGAKLVVTARIVLPTLTPYARLNQERDEV